VGRVLGGGGVCAGGFCYGLGGLVMKIEIEVDDRLKFDGFELVRIGVPKRGEWALATNDWLSWALPIYRKLPPPKQYRDPTNADIGKPCEVQTGGKWKPAIYCGYTCSLSNGCFLFLFGSDQQVSASRQVRIEVTNEDN